MTNQTNQTVGQMHLTRRGRVVVALLTLGLGSLGFSSIAAASSPAEPRVTYNVIVAPGETLWGIASDAVEPGEDIRDMVSEIKTLNHLTSSTLAVGQMLEVPVSSGY